MSKAKHTPGPWIVDDRCIEAPFDGGSKIIGSVVGGLNKGSFRVGSKREQAANARLIAAAPDLLAACEELDEWLDAVAVGLRVMTLRDTVRAAIAKATGTA